MRRKQAKKSSRSRAKAGKGVQSPLRIIGGKFRGSVLDYHGDPRTRPMKDRVREALFNLIGPAVKGLHAIDLFAGTGALGLEAISRGAVAATFTEQHFPTARCIRENAARLKLTDQVDVITGDAFIWSTRDLPLAELPWLVLCSPPYDFYVDRAEQMLALIERMISHAAPGSLIAVEADRRFDFTTLPSPELWDVRTYSPAVVGLLEVE